MPTAIENLSADLGVLKHALKAHKLSRPPIVSEGNRTPLSKVARYEDCDYHTFPAHGTRRR